MLSAPGAPSGSGRRVAATEGEDALFGVMVEAVPDLLFAAGPDGTVEYVNERFLEYTGLSLATAKGDGWATALHPDEVAPNRERWQAASRNGEPFVNEYRLRRADGAYRWFVGRSRPVRDADGEIVRWVGSCTDIDDRKRAEERLRFLAGASSTLAGSLDYEATLRGVTDLVVPALADFCVVDIVEPDGSVRPLAAAHVDAGKLAVIEGLRRRFPIGVDAGHGYAWVIGTGTPELLPTVPDAIYEQVGGDREQRRLMRSLGVRSHVCVPLVARGQVLGALTMATTAESGRDLGEPDLALAGELAGRSALAIDNARLYGHAQQAIRLRDEFLSNVSHDLKSPLTAIKGRAQLLRRHLARAQAVERERVEAAAREIEDLASRVADLIEELQEVAQARVGGGLTIARRPTDLVALVREEARLQETEATGHRIVVEAAAPSLLVEADPTRLRRVLSNLLVNAVKYSPAGGQVRVVVRSEAAGDAHGRCAVIEVSDRGVGIPEDDLPRVFERFHRGRNVAERFEGRGIGLAGVQQIVAMHGGSVDVESTEGEGSRFTVRLPMGSLDLRG